MTMHVNLGEEFERFVKAKIETGRYQSASEVVREALRLLEQRDEMHDLERQALRKAIDQGFLEAEQGDLLDGPAAMQRIRQKIRNSDPKT